MGSIGTTRVLAPGTIPATIDDRTGLGRGSGAPTPSKGIPGTRSEFHDKRGLEARHLADSDRKPGPAPKQPALASPRSAGRLIQEDPNVSNQPLTPNISPWDQVNPNVTESTASISSISVTDEILHRVTALQIAMTALQVQMATVLHEVQPRRPNPGISKKP